MSFRLSILIPAFGYAEGIERILTSLIPFSTDEVEILISDDSIDDQVYKITTKYINYYQGNLSYRRNTPGLGAVENWNSLLDQATGEFVILLHHDEYPLGNNFIKNTLKILDSNLDVDVFAMNCILTSSSGQEVRPHVPFILRKIVLNRFPEYLFKRNIVGPASCLIVRRSLYPRFDAELRWLVDVDTFFRLRNTTTNWLVLKDLKVASTLGRNDSITASIKENINQLETRERAYLKQKFPIANIWLRPQDHFVVNAIEYISWATMRITTRLYHKLHHIHLATLIYSFCFPKKFQK